MKKHLFRFLIASGFAAVIAIYIALSLFYLPDNKASAQSSLPSSKSAIQLGDLNVMSGTLSNTGANATGWMDVMKAQMKTSQQKDMVMTVSMEVGLFTKTTVSSKLATPDTSTASAGVEMRMVIDPGTANERIAYPGTVVFGRRTQTLSATLQGIIDKCLTLSNGSIVLDPTCVTPEEISLVLDTMNANAFVFAMDQLGAGTHTMKAQARIKLNTSVQLGTAEARAILGKGSMSVEEVRLVKDAQITL